MYQIKAIPEDFIVKEISNVNIGKAGHFTYFVLKKRDYNTLTAIQRIADKLGINVKRFSFAGNKDKAAVTQQLVSVKDVSEELLSRLSLKDISIDVVGYGVKPVSLGDLSGNDFRITVRNLIKEDLDRLDNKLSSDQLIPNLFGEQRFSKNNKEIGKALIKKDLEKAVSIILENDGNYEKEVKEYLNKHENDFVGALRKINKKILRIFVSAYQSDIFNKVVKEYCKDKKKNIKVPIVGFGTEIEDIEDEELRKIIKNILDKEGLSPRDFIIREIPELSIEGVERDMFMDVKDLQVKEIGEDTINKKYKAVLSFSLGAGSYATEVIRYLFG